MNGLNIQGAGRPGRSCGRGRSECLKEGTATVSCGVCRVRGWRRPVSLNFPRRGQWNVRVAEL